MATDETSAIPFESAARAVEEEMRKLGVSLSPEHHEQISDSELMEMAYYEKAKERGLL